MRSQRLLYSLNLLSRPGCTRGCAGRLRRTGCTRGYAGRLRRAG